MFDPPNKEFDEITTSVDLSTIVDYYAKDFELKDKK